MVAIVHAAPPASFVSAQPQAFTDWVEQIGGAYSLDERAAIGKAIELARTRYGALTTADGEPWIDRALGTASLVAGLKLDAASVLGAVLLGMPHAAGFDVATLAEVFGDEVAQMVAGATRMGAIRAAPD